MQIFRCFSTIKSNVNYIKIRRKNWTFLCQTVHSRNLYIVVDVYGETIWFINNHGYYTSRCLFTESITTTMCLLVKHLIFSPLSCVPGSRLSGFNQHVTNQNAIMRSAQADIWMLKGNRCRTITRQESRKYN